MPELPEVETVRRSLQPLVVSRRVAGVRLGAFAGVLDGIDGESFFDLVIGRLITDVRRRAKYLYLVLDDDAAVVIHLRMTGHLTVVARALPPVRFERLALEFDDQHDLRFADQRKFGRVSLMHPGDLDRLDRRLGPEPLSPRFTAGGLAGALASRSGKLKSVLLDQELIAGLGNIYVDEALFRARLHPTRPANSLTAAEVGRLHRAIRAALREGLANRGTTFSTFQDASGEPGANQHALRVYGRGGRGQCERCGGEIERIVVGGRGTHLCPRCQPASLVD
jgi:formamidopyrimidine-DNA glycosylase